MAGNTALLSVGYQFCKLLCFTLTINKAKARNVYTFPPASALDLGFSCPAHLYNVDKV